MVKVSLLLEWVGALSRRTLELAIKQAGPILVIFVGNPQKRVIRAIAALKMVITMDMILTLSVTCVVLEVTRSLSALTGLERLDPQATHGT